MKLSFEWTWSTGRKVEGHRAVRLLLIIMAATLGSAAMIVVLVQASFAHSVTCTTAVLQARTCPRVVQSLGGDIRAGWFITGGAGADDAHLEIPVRGSLGSGRLFAEGVKLGERWTIRALEYQADDSPGRIDLLALGCAPANTSPGRAADDSRGADAVTADPGPGQKRPARMQEK